MSASVLTWQAAGPPSQEPPLEAAPGGVCATCGAPISLGVHLSHIETPTTSGHADLFRHGGQHVCPACAWLYAAGKGRPGNYLATPQRLEYTVISVESVVEDKRPWLQVLPELALLPPDTPVTGVMTTDVKPRLWPRCRLATVGAAGLYLHVPDYDVSEWRRFDLRACLATIDAMLPMLRAGFAKASLYHGLLRDFGRASRDLPQAMAWESELRTLRGAPHFLPALIAAGVTKEAKSRDDIRKQPQPAAASVADPEPAAAAGREPDDAQLGLF